MIHKHKEIIDWLRKYKYKVKIETNDYDSDFWASKYDETALTYVDGVFEMYSFVNNEIVDYAYRIKTCGFANLPEIYTTIKVKLNDFENYHLIHNKFGEEYQDKLNGIKEDFK